MHKRLTNLRPCEPCAHFTTLLHQVLLFQTGIKSYFKLHGKKGAEKNLGMKQLGLLIDCVNPLS